ncbi:MAG TPA: rhodanese-like domain-containing protein [Gammaproteobacteria bacterium]|nr:rhodanese-like domain-containing protein [Gammaproteobacteria bacterium]
MTKISKLLATITLVTAATATFAGKTEGPATVDGATTINVAEAQQLFDAEVPFIDTRKNGDWEAGRIPGAYHLDVKKALNEKSLGEVVGKNDPVVFYCNGIHCLRSSKASAKAVAWGYTNVKYFRTGFPSWKAAGNPVE